MPYDPLQLEAGRLRHAIDIQRPDYAGGADSRGMSVTPSSYVSVRSTRAEIIATGGLTSAQAAAIVTDASHVVRVRWASAVIKPSFRVVFGLRTFTVKYVENVAERNRVLNLYCMEVDGGGL